MNGFAFGWNIGLKGTKRQQNGQIVKIFKTEKALEIQQARLTEACGKVDSK